MNASERPIDRGVADLAARNGFFAWGAADAGEVDDRGRYLAYLERGYHGAMQYLSRTPELRIDPRRVLPGARSVLVFLRAYGWPAPPVPCGHARVAAYARGLDYHASMKTALHAIAASLQGARSRVFVDTGPVLERYWARRAGLAGIGKNGLCVRADAGSKFFIGVVLTDRHFPATHIEPPDLCGDCDLCLRACPTGALVAPRLMDASRCLSYFTIEHRGEIPAPVRPAMGDTVFGCDRCQDACPLNRRDHVPGHDDARPRPPFAAPRLADLLAWDTAAFDALAADRALARATAKGIRRNALIIAANLGDRSLIEAYARAPADPDLAALAAQLLSSH